MFWRKKTIEEKMQQRTSELMQTLTSNNEHSFTEIEEVHILKELLRVYKSHLENKENENIEKSKIFDEKSKNVREAIEYLNF